MIMILHKMEGRLFLVGRNGFYNKLYEELYQLVKGNFFFLLNYKKLNSDNSLDEQTEVLNNLITKGDQEQLQIFKEENKIIFIDDEKTFEDLEKFKMYFLNLFYRKFTINSKDTNDNEAENARESEKILSKNTNFINSQHRQFTNDEYLLIDQLIIKLKNKILKENGKSKEFLRCSVL